MFIVSATEGSSVSNYTAPTGKVAKCTQTVLLLLLLLLLHMHRKQIRIVDAMLCRMAENFLFH